MVLTAFTCFKMRPRIAEVSRLDQKGISASAKMVPMLPEAFLSACNYFSGCDAAIPTFFYLAPRQVSKRTTATKHTNSQRSWESQAVRAESVNHLVLRCVMFPCIYRRKCFNLSAKSAPDAKLLKPAIACDSATLQHV